MRLLSTRLESIGGSHGLHSRHCTPKGNDRNEIAVPDGRSAAAWAAGLAIVPGVLALGLGAGVNPAMVVIVGLLLFGAVFAINSSLHSYLIVSYAGLPATKASL